MASARRVYRTQRTRQTGHPPGNTARWRASRLHLSRSSGADPPSGWVARCNAGHRPDHRENQVEAVEPFHGVMRRAVLCLRPREDKQFPCALAQPPSRSKLANLQLPGAGDPSGCSRRPRARTGDAASVASRQGAPASPLPRAFWHWVGLSGHSHPFDCLLTGRLGCSGLS